MLRCECEMSRLRGGGKRICQLWMPRFHGYQVYGVGIVMFIGKVGGYYNVHRESTGR